ncbi:hypothetical protein G7054_g1742 [Neopestalotiopsis clavispora]|nr:hypothetical protein G7054_g1742 [Neopestalotiopsis clavispora]
MGDEFGWTAEDDVAMHGIGDSLESDMNPGATVMWFGEHEGARINELTEEYRRHLEHRSYWTRTPDLLRFRDLHTRYLDWLDQGRSPLSATVWFGKRALLDMVRRYNQWRDVHEPDWRYRRRRRRDTQGRMIVNKVGERLLPSDDRPASDYDDSYATDDSFIVPDAETDAEQEDASSLEENDPFGPSSDAESDVILDGDFDAEQQESRVIGTMESEGELTPRSAARRDERRQPLTRFGDNDGDSDNEFPSVAAMFRTPQRIRASRSRAVNDGDVRKPTRIQRSIVVSSSSASHAASGGEDDEDEGDDEARPQFPNATNRLFDIEAKGGREGRIGTRVRTSPRKVVSHEISPGDDDTLTRNTRASARILRSIPRLPPPREEEENDSSSSNEPVQSPTKRISFMGRSTKVSPMRRRHSQVVATPGRRSAHSSPRKSSVSPSKQSTPQEPVSLITSEEDAEPVRSASKRRDSRMSVSQPYANRRNASPYDSDDLPIYPKDFGRSTAAPANSMESPMSLDSDDKPLRPRSSPTKHTPAKEDHAIGIDSDDEPIRPTHSRRKQAQPQEMYIDSDDEPITPRKLNRRCYR